jgi:predicted nuclease with TOPRIM domain
LPDLTKHEVLLNELSEIQTLVAELINNIRTLRQENTKLERSFSGVREENKMLLQKMEALEKQLEEEGNNSLNSTLGSLDNNEKEELKNRIRNLVSRIDLHLSS